jgi:hypothetical protein
VIRKIREKRKQLIQLMLKILSTERSSLDAKVLSYVLHNYYILTFVSFVILFFVHQKH